jgi:hypothetical protein
MAARSSVWAKNQAPARVTATRALAPGAMHCRGQLEITGPLVFLVERHFFLDRDPVLLDHAGHMIAQ